MTHTCPYGRLYGGWGGGGGGVGEPRGVPILRSGKPGGGKNAYGVEGGRKDGGFYPRTKYVRIFLLLEKSGLFHTYQNYDDVDDS
jgi:hypothetical protein